MLLCVAIIVAHHGLLRPAHAVNLVSNAGFESVETTYGGSSFPTGYGDWHGDVSEIVGAQNGITPFDSRMLHFVNALKTGPDGANVGSNQWQILDVSGYSAEIASGTAMAEFSAMFNRVPGDNQTDTEFFIEVSAYQGLPSSFPSQANSSELALYKASILTDGDVGTWQMASGNLMLPVNTDFIVVEITAVENVFNDSVNPEFDGHYADQVIVRIVPEPSAWILATLGVLGLGYCSVRRRHPLAV